MTGLCQSAMRRASLALVKPELRPQAVQARCHEPYGHKGGHELAILVPNGTTLVRVTLRWPKRAPRG